MLHCKALLFCCLAAAGSYFPCRADTITTYSLNLTTLDNTSVTGTVQVDFTTQTFLGFDIVAAPDSNAGLAYDPDAGASWSSTDPGIVYGFNWDEGISAYQAASPYYGFTLSLSASDFYNALLPPSTVAITGTPDQFYLTCSNNCGIQLEAYGSLTSPEPSAACLILSGALSLFVSKRWRRTLH